MSLTEAESGSATGIGDAQLDQILNELLPGGVTDELRAAFKADAKLMVTVKQIAAARALEDQLAEARAALDPAKKPAQWIGGIGPGNIIGREENPAYTSWKQKTAAADALLKQYYSDFQYTEPNAAMKAKATQTAQAITAARNQVGVIQTRLEKETGATATNPPDLVWLPTGTPGEERAHVYDPAAKTYVPAKDAAGNPLPVKKVAQPATPAVRVAEGTQSWELKELEGTWYQVPIRARADGTWEPDTSRTPQPASGFPSGGPKVEVYDGIPYTRTGPNGGLVPVPGYVKPPMFRTDARGNGFISTDNGATWKPAQGLPGTPQTMTSNGSVYPLDENGLPIVDRGVRLPPGEQTQTVDGYLVRADPATGQVTRVDLYTPEQRARLEETAQLGLAAGRQQLENAQRLPDPVAEYQRQVGLLQTTATKYRDDLNNKVLQGQLSVEDASKQFDDWWGSNVEAKLQPYQTMAEGAYRKEQNEYLQRQAAEQARVEALNRAREQIGYQAGETARAGLNALAPQARSPEFLAQFAQNVSNIGKPLPGGPSQHSGGMQFSPESLSLANVRRAMPNLTEVGQNAAARALAQISPAAAQQVGAPPPQPPSLPDFQSFMNRAPFQIPNPALPVPGRAALDLGNPANAGLLGLPVQPGYAATQYQGGRIEPWQIPAA